MPSARSNAGKLSVAERQAKVQHLYKDLLVLPPPGLSAIKENELSKKVKAVVPPTFQGAYPDTSKETDDKEKKRRQEKYQRQKAGVKRKEEEMEEYNAQLLNSKKAKEAEEEANKDGELV